jgi:hypothetical protein
VSVASERVDHAAVDTQGGAGGAGSQRRGDVDDHICPFLHAGRALQDRAWPVRPDELGSDCLDRLTVQFSPLRQKFGDTLGQCWPWQYRIDRDT